MVSCPIGQATLVPSARSNAVLQQARSARSSTLLAGGGLIAVLTEERSRTGGSRPLRCKYITRGDVGGMEAC